MASLTWSTSIQVAGSATVSAAQGPLDVEAIDRVEVSIAGGVTNQLVSLQPGPAAAVGMLLIKSSRYHSDVTYKANDGAADGAGVQLLAPHLFTGGSVALLGVAPKALKFSNAGADPVKIEIFVARDATP